MALLAAGRINFRLRIRQQIYGSISGFRTVSVFALFKRPPKKADYRTIYLVCRRFYRSKFTRHRLEYSKRFPVFAALFADRETSEIRTALRILLDTFQNTHTNILGNWNGDMSYFEKDKTLIEQHFKEFL